jgi:anti-sigma factor ChrR (cupin superfamily)
MEDRQSFIDSTRANWMALEFLPGVDLLPLAEPVPKGSVHLARLSVGTIIPRHTHPSDEFVYVLSGTIKTGDTQCPAGTFWRTPAGIHQGPHVAVTDVQILTIRLGAMGEFERSGRLTRAKQKSRNPRFRGIPRS